MSSKSSLDSGGLGGLVFSASFVGDRERRAQKRPDPARLSAQMLTLGKRLLLDQP